jgi:hypothetical protein
VRQALRALAAALALVAVTASAAAAATTPRAYRQQVRVLCTETRRQVQAVEPEQMSQAVIVATMRRDVAVIASFSDRFRRIQPPASLRAAHLEAVAAWSRAIPVLRALVSRLAQGQKFERLLTTRLGKRLEANDDALTRAFERLGIPACTT